MEQIRSSPTYKSYVITELTLCSPYVTLTCTVLLGSRRLKEGCFEGGTYNGKILSQKSRGDFVDFTLAPRNVLATLGFRLASAALTIAELAPGSQP